MDILFYNSYSLRVGSGPEHWLMEVTQQLQKFNNKITVVSPSCEDHEERFSFNEVTKRLGKVKYVEFSCLKFPKLSSSPLPTNLLDTFGKHADLIYFLNGFALQDVFITLDKILTKTPVICGLHGPLITTYGLHNLYVSVVLKRNLRSYNACHALNSFYVQLLHSWGVKNVYLIPNGINTQKFRPLTNVRTDENFKILFIGRFAYEKGIDILCKAIDLINTKNAQAGNMQFTLVGRGPLASFVQVTTSKYANVKMETFIPEEKLIEVYSSHHLFVLPARFETFPLPPLEAQACGLPVITSNIPGTREQISKGGGAVIEAGDYVALAAEIIKYYNLWKNAKGQFELQAKAARGNILKNFELQDIVKKINGMFIEVTSGNLQTRQEVH